MGLSIWHLLVVLIIALIIFGTKKIRNLGGDLGGAIKNFKTAMRDEEAEAAGDKPALESKPAIEAKATVKPEGARAAPGTKTRKKKV